MSATAHRIREVAVVGFGLMGAQIGQVFAQNGLTVRAYDVSNEQLRQGLDLVSGGKYGLENSIKKGRMTSREAEEVLSRISAEASIDRALTGAEFVLEAAVEELNTKREIFVLASELADTNAVLATNASTLSGSKISAPLPMEARSRAVGMHFFNPPQVMKLVEVVRSESTSEDTLKVVADLAIRLGKTPIVTRDTPGFVANRIGISVFAEASRILEENIATIRDIDVAMRLGYSYPMGPFELGDLVGLDSRLRNMEAIFSATGDERFRPPDLLKKLVSEGYLGDPKAKRESKGGYYEYFGVPRPTENK